MNNLNKINRVSIDGMRPSISHLAIAVTVAIFSASAQAGKMTAVSSASGANGFGGFNLGIIGVILGGDPLASGDSLSTLDAIAGTYRFSPGTYAVCRSKQLFNYNGRGL